MFVPSKLCEAAGLEYLLVVEAPELIVVPIERVTGGSIIRGDGEVRQVCCQFN
jgi:hypothetical protein